MSEQTGGTARTRWEGVLLVGAIALFVVVPLWMGFTSEDVHDCPPSGTALTHSACFR